MSANLVKNFLGYMQLQKTAGSGAVVNGTTFQIPFNSMQPRDPKNNAYPNPVNKDAFPSIVILGKRTPSLSFTAFLKSSWCSAALFNSLLTAFDANNDADEWAIKINDGSTGGAWSNRIFDGCRLSALSFAQSAASGGVLVSFGFLAKTGQGSTVFGAASNPDAGFLVDVSQIDFGGAPTANLVRGYQIACLRGTAYEMFFNGTYYPDATASGMLGGQLILEQSPKYTVSPGSSFVARLGPIGTPILTATMLVNPDEDVYDIAPGFGDIFRRYSLIDISAGGAPVLFS